MGNTLIIQPDYQLLVDLIGTEATLQLRQGIVETFAERHLKAVANSQEIKERLDWLKKELSAEFSRQVEAQVGKIKSNYYMGGTSQSIQLSDAYLTEVKKFVTALAEQTLVDQINPAIQQRYNELVDDMDKRLDARLEKYFNTALEARIKTEVDKRLAAVVLQLSGK